MCKFEENRPIRGGARPLYLRGIFRGRCVSNVILEFACFLRVNAPEMRRLHLYSNLQSKRHRMSTFWAEAHSGKHHGRRYLLARAGGVHEAADLVLPMHNVKFNWYCSRFSTFDGAYYHELPYRPKILRKSVSKIFKKIATISPCLVPWIRPWFSTFCFCTLICYRPVCWKPNAVYSMILG